MHASVIDAVKRAGFSVYMLDGDASKTWAIFTDGANIGYLQDDRPGYSIGTLHRPNQQSGTGFSVRQRLDVTDLDRETLSCAFDFTPAWVGAQDRASVRKYRGMKDFLDSNSFNARHREV